MQKLRVCRPWAHRVHLGGCAQARRWAFLSALACLLTASSPTFGAVVPDHALPAENLLAAPDCNEAWAPPQATVVAAEPVSFIMQRQEYGYWTYFLLQGPDGAARGVVERRHWRQPFRRSYETFDVEGKSVARATSPWLSFGNLFVWNAAMNFRDRQGRPLGRLSGRLWTLRAASYTLFAADGSKVADVAVDDQAQGVVFFAPGTRRRIASFMREQQATRGSDRWAVRVDEGDALPAPSWPLIAAFFADTWSQLARTHTDG